MLVINHTIFLKVLAYLDPGSGSVLLQLLIATLVGAAFILKTYWKKIKTFFQKSSPPTDDAQDE